LTTLAASGAGPAAYFVQLRLPRLWGDEIARAVGLSPCGAELTETGGLGRRLADGCE